MKRITTIALMVNLAIASVYAQHPVKMMFSGTGGASSIDLKQPNTGTAEENVAGYGTLGQFTFRRCQGCRKCSATVHHLRGPLFSKCGRRGRASLPRWESIGGHVSRKEVIA